METAKKQTLYNEQILQKNTPVSFGPLFNFSFFILPAFDIKRSAVQLEVHRPLVYYSVFNTGCGLL